MYAVEPDWQILANQIQPACSGNSTKTASR